MEIAASIIGRPLVSEAGPDRRIAVEVKDEVRPQPLKEGSLLNSFKCLQSCLFRETSASEPCLAEHLLGNTRASLLDPTGRRKALLHPFENK